MNSGSVQDGGQVCPMTADQAKRVRGSQLQGVEKRKFQRLDFPLQVQVTVVTEEDPAGQDPSCIAKCLNVSLQGICLETPNILLGPFNILSGSPGSREYILRLAFSCLPDTAPVIATGQVCWYDVACESDDFRYQVGIVFLEIEGDGREQLKRFLKTNRKKTGFFQSLWARVAH